MKTEPGKKYKYESWYTRPKRSVFDFYDSPEGVDFITKNMDGVSNEESGKLNKLMKSKLPKSEPEKKIIKKEINVAEKPKSVIELLEFYDKLNLLDPIWWETVEEEEDEKVLLPVPKSKAKGITAILNLHKKLT